MSIIFGETDNDLTAQFTVHAPPKGKQRPRVTLHGTYTPKETREYEKLIQLEYMTQCQGAMFPDVPLMIVIYAYFPIPKSTSKKKREQMQNGEIRPTVKSDWDNIAKAVCDALNKQAWHDDAQIVTGIVHKYYDEEPRVEVIIRTV